MDTARDVRQYHACREKRRQQQREDLRRRRYELVRATIELTAPAHPGIRAVYLFGSLVQPGRFTSASDVDVAVDCEDAAAESRFWQALEKALQAHVDLRPRRGAVALAVECQGECVYERAPLAARA